MFPDSNICCKVSVSYRCGVLIKSPSGWCGLRGKAG